jgi:hypothetical protein
MTRPPGKRGGWGFPPASEERIAAMEERLGRRVSPSYREFLEVGDGWRHAGGFVWLPAGTGDAHGHNNVPPSPITTPEVPRCGQA